MIFIRSLHWTVTVLLLAIVHPSISLPIPASEWALRSSHEGEVGNAKNQNSWNVNDQEESFSPSESAQAELKLPQLSRNDGPQIIHTVQTQEDLPLPAKPIVSVLIPVSPVFVKPSHVYQEDTFENDSFSTAKMAQKKYGQMLESSKPNYVTSEKFESEFPTIQFSSGHYISFLSYRVSFPFLKFAPVAFPSFPLPGIFMTVIILLALVWIAILTVGLVEFGNYLWNNDESTRWMGRRRSRIEDASNEEENAAGLEGLSKVELEVVGIPRLASGGNGYEDSSLLAGRSDSDSESDIDESIV